MGEKDGDQAEELYLAEEGNVLVGHDEQTEPLTELLEFSIAHELWREYDFGGRVYRIWRPQTLWFRPGGETHRVLDLAGVVHCVPAPGRCGCVLRWVNAPGHSPCRF